MLNDLIPFLPLIIYYGIASGYFDSKYRKVPNWLTLSAMVAGILLHIAIAYKAYVLYGTVNTKYLIDQGLNIAVATILAITIYYVDLAAPGDGKMIITYATIIPVSAFHKGYFWPYPGIVHVAISYALAYAVVFINNIPRVKKQDVLDGLRKLADPKVFGKLFIMVAGISKIFTTVMRLLGLNANPAAVILFTMALIALTQNMGRRIVLALSLAGIALWIHHVITRGMPWANLGRVLVATIMLGVIFYPFQKIVQATKEIVPMGVFLFAGAILTLFAVT